VFVVFGNQNRRGHGPQTVAHPGGIGKQNEGKLMIFPVGMIEFPDKQGSLIFTMNRWVRFSLCGIAGFAACVCAWLIPAHLRAVDLGVIRQAGKDTQSVAAEANGLLAENKLGAAQMMLAAARKEGLPGADKLNAAVQSLAQAHPGWVSWGGGEPRFENLFSDATSSSNSSPEPFTEFVIHLDNRQKALEFLKTSGRPGVAELLQIRNLTNTTQFPPSASSSGQALDAAVAICGLLLDGGHITAGLSKTIVRAAAEANRGGDTEPLEDTLMDFMSLGQRLNWGQLAEFVDQIEDAGTLHKLTGFLRNSQDRAPVLFSVVQFADKAPWIARYLTDFGKTGFDDLATSLRYGSGGVNELLRRDQQLHRPRLFSESAGPPVLRHVYTFSLDYCLRWPWIALTVKWLLYLAGGFLLAMALHWVRPVGSVLERPLQVRGFHVAREFLFALGFLLVVLLLSEPFLSQGGQKVEMPFRLRLPTVGGTALAWKSSVNSTFMNQTSLLTLLLFFVLQALLYVACLVKLAEIRRQRVESRVKLKLLENEEHLFDAGLYLGFAGTIVSLILVSLNISEFSIMAAYSSTSFGIIFVSIFKIFHLRPAKRLLLMESETGSGTPPSPVSARPLPSSP
jgi:hypothetical protein